MRRYLFLVILLYAAPLFAQADYIRYYPPAGIFTSSGSSFFASGIGLGGTVASPYANLYGDAANTLAQRNGTAAQTFNIYNTYTDASNYERGEAKWSSNELVLESTAAGTGTLRTLVLGVGGARFKIAAASFYGGSHDNYQLGQSGIGFTSLFLNRSIQGSKSKALTDAGGAVAVITVPVATSGYQAGEVIWNAQSTDATDFRTTEGSIRFAGVNKAGTPTCTIGVIGTDLTASSNANTLVCTWTNVVATTNCNLSVTCTDNTAGSQTMTINFRADMPTTAPLVFP